MNVHTNAIYSKIAWSPFKLFMISDSAVENCGQADFSGIPRPGLNYTNYNEKCYASFSYSLHLQMCLPRQLYLRKVTADEMRSETYDCLDVSHINLIYWVLNDPKTSVGLIE